MNKGLQISIELASYKDELVRKIAAHTADLNAAISTIRDGSFSSHAQNHNFRGVIAVSYEGIDVATGGERRVISKCFRSIISDFAHFLDTMIAIQQVAIDGIKITNALTGEKEILIYAKNYLETQISKVARDTSLNLPQKIGKFPIAVEVADALLSYFVLRNGIEHHGGLLNKAVDLTTFSLKIYADQEEIKSLPHHLKKGGGLSMRIVKETRTIPANTNIDISEEELRKMIFTMEQVAASEILLKVEEVFKTRMIV